ncbi:hypothetical protein BDP27DRAFT_1323690 [Rhodocollybia butyracea]|uniref:Uncharacterized protein n=1 Tax=Rhodocollybia butyracea TaxID=206335 RepID=A0A9P5PQR5_9AGAR|nr:hypothetical protein BDP27DRAFT_1323690 [Rhodocollybia butyracea]
MSTDNSHPPESKASMANTLMSSTLAKCSPVSFLQFKSSSWLGATVFVLSLVFAEHYRLARKAYETTNREIMALLPHLICFLALVYIAYWFRSMEHSLATCLPNGFAKGGAENAALLALVVITHWFCDAKHYVLPPKMGYQEMALYRSWVGLGSFVDASEFYLPAIEAAVDLRDLTAAARDDHDRDVQTLRDKIGEYKTFYRKAVESEAFGEDSDSKLTALQKTITRSVSRLETMNTTYPCPQQSDKDRLDRMFRKIFEVFNPLPGVH